MVNRPRNERIGWRLTNTDSARRIRLQYLASPLYVLGPRPLFHSLDEVERGADLRPHLECYAEIYPRDKFAPIVHVIDGAAHEN